MTSYIIDYIVSVQFHVTNQSALIEAGIGLFLVTMLGNRNRELQTAAVEAVYRLTQDNVKAQRHLLAVEAWKPLLQFLSRNPVVVVQEMTAQTLWLIAGISSC